MPKLVFFHGGSNVTECGAHRQLLRSNANDQIAATQTNASVVCMSLSLWLHCVHAAVQVSASAHSTVVVTHGVDKGSGLPPVNEVYQWGHGGHTPSRVNFNSVRDGGSSSRWQTHDARVNITQVAAARNHNVALSSVGRVFVWGLGADFLGEV